jgi:hypothetical protein
VSNEDEYKRFAASKDKANITVGPVDPWERRLVHRVCPKLEQSPPWAGP